MENTPVLGQLITGDPPRDAVHIAIAPVTAAHPLTPGQHVGRYNDGTFGVMETSEFIGIVDPFLKAGPEKGERFYLFLYPNTVTSLRHAWTHPAFRPKLGGT